MMVAMTIAAVNPMALRTAISGTIFDPSNLVSAARNAVHARLCLVVATPAAYLTFKHKLSITPVRDSRSRRALALGAQQADPERPGSEVHIFHPR